MSDEIKGYYYLDVKGNLIYLTGADSILSIRDDNEAKAAWCFMNDRACAWKILVEALAAGAKKERILELAEKWKCSDNDAEQYAEYLGIDIGEDGNQKYARRKDFINIQESPIGFGDTYLQAMADLCDELGYTPSKMWGNEFKNLVQ